MPDQAALRDTFETVAGHYDVARPSYPLQLFADLVELAELSPGARLLEVGCGTGKATRALAERGYPVTCVELGSELARIARERLAGLPVDVHTAAFESWDGPAGSFDLVYAATAWHWVDPALGYRRAHELLRPGGRLALWSAQHAFPPGHDPFFAEIQATHEAIGESHEGEWPPPEPDDVVDESTAIEAGGLFEDVRTRRYVWAIDYTADEYVALLETFSGHIAMEAEARARLYGDVRALVGSRPAGTIRRHWLAILHVARAVR